uniref:HAD-IC family P-type ATPase n=1 Tax=Bacillus altitudinis TaxID=293387 RepID=UPI001F195CEF
MDGEIEENGDVVSCKGYRVVYVEKNEEVVGCVGLKDEMRGEGKKMIEEVNDLGIESVMVRGDEEKTAEGIGEEGGMERVVGECVGDEKVEEVNEVKKEGDWMIMVGDGMNDGGGVARGD